VTGGKIEEGSWLFTDFSDKAVDSRAEISFPKAAPKELCLPIASGQLAMPDRTET